MRKRLMGMLIAVPTLLVGLLTAIPAEAATFYLSVKSANVAIDTAGNGKVFVKCYASTTCRGKVYFTFDRTSPSGDFARKYRTYAVGAKSAGYINVAMYANSPLNPNTNPDESNGEIDIKRNVALTVVESSPRGSKTVHSYPNLTAETKLSGQQIEGNLSAAAGSANIRDMQVRLITPLRGGNERLVDTKDVTPGGSYQFYVPFTTNNVSAYDYRLEISGVDQYGEVRTWWWRGRDGTTTGGGRYIRDASVIKPSKFKNFEADFRYGFISGKIDGDAENYAKAGVDVTVASPPPAYSSNTSDLRELDIQRCANVFGRARTKAGGTYRVDFLPATGYSDNRYMIGVQSEFGSREWETWRGTSDSDVYGSCYDATKYSTASSARDNLLTLSPGVGLINKNTSVALPNNVARIPVRTSGFTPTAADQWIRIREKIPGLAVQDMPIIQEGQGKVGTRKEFKLQPGNYLVETGRFSGDTGVASTRSPSLAPCSGWYPSIYANNDLYFKGAERGAEQWKTVSGSVEETSTSVRNGYVRRSPGGYKGWMYRGYCKSLSAGTHNNVISFSNTGEEKIIDTTTAKRGGVVYGKVKRNGGRSPKEMIVRVSNTGGNVVARYDVSDSGGRFYVAGLQKGSYSISVNADSWRGIDRGFAGRHTIYVPGGGNYSAGTLTFRG